MHKAVGFVAELKNGCSTCTLGTTAADVVFTCWCEVTPLRKAVSALAPFHCTVTTKTDSVTSFSR